MVVLECVDVLEKEMRVRQVANFFELDKPGGYLIEQGSNLSFAAFNELCSQRQQLSAINSAKWFKFSISTLRYYRPARLWYPQKKLEQLGCNEGQITGHEYHARCAGVCERSADCFERTNANMDIGEYGKGEHLVPVAVGNDRNLGGYRRQGGDDALDQRLTIDLQPRFIGAHARASAASSDESACIEHVSLEYIS